MQPVIDINKFNVHYTGCPHPSPCCVKRCVLTHTQLTQSWEAYSNQDAPFMRLIYHFELMGLAEVQPLLVVL